MAFKYNGDATLKGNLNVSTNKPLDARSVVQSLSDLYGISDKVAYIGMCIVVIDEEAIYMLKNLTNIANNTGWKKIGSITIDSETGEIDLTDYATLTYVNEAIQNAIENMDVPNPITVDSIVTETGSNPVKSSGIFTHVKQRLNAKFIVLTEAEYNNMAKHDDDTFYFIRQ